MSVVSVAMPRTERPSWLRIWILAISVLEVWSAMVDLPAGFVDPDVGSHAAMTAFARIDVLLAPFFAVAALVFAIGGTPRLAILASALLTLLAFICDLPMMMTHGLDVTPDLAGLETALASVGAPAAALFALVLVARRTFIGLAAGLAGTPVVIALLVLLARGH